jgi:hypothetical protein
LTVVSIKNKTYRNKQNGTIEEKTMNTIKIKRGMKKSKETTRNGTHKSKEKM